MEFIEFIPRIVKGFEFKQGSMVLLNFWGENKDLDILDRFAIEIGKLGAVPVKIQQSREFAKDYYTEVSEEYLVFPDKYFEIYKMADSVVDIFTYTPSFHQEFPKEKMSLYGQYMQKLFAALGHNKDKFIQVRVPTEEIAEQEDVDLAVYKNAMCSALMVDLDNLKKEADLLLSKLAGKKKIKVITSADHTLEFLLGERTWNKDCGDGDIPCGEIYIAPLEETVNGSIVIEKVILEKQEYFNVLFKFVDGKLVDCSEEEIFAFIKRFPGDSDIFAEFGIGLNNKVTKLTGCQVIDEKIKGTAHIAIGMNNLFGGKNNTPLHLDFIFRPEGVTADEEIIM